MIRSRLDSTAQALPAALPAGGLDLPIDAILDRVRHHAGVDFRLYRRPTVERRLLARMAVANAGSVAAYEGLLAADPAEVDKLLGTLTVKVSSFFRDARAWAALTEALRERLARGAGELRIWSAGCAFGQEPYGLAMLALSLGWDPRRVSVLATDVDPAALARATEGRYPESAADELPAAFRERFVERLPRELRIAGWVRNRVTFRRHDLTVDEPLADARFDLVACRNTLIYFGPAVQAGIQRRLVGALDPGGLLFLGEAESPSPAVAAGLEALHQPARLFRRAHGDGR